MATLTVALELLALFALGYLIWIDRQDRERARILEELKPLEEAVRLRLTALGASPAYRRGDSTCGEDADRTGHLSGSRKSKAAADYEQPRKED